MEGNDLLSSNPEKRIFLEWKGKYKLEGRNNKGLSVKFDATMEHGGEETALTPMENVLASLAACSSYDVLTILKKKRQKISKLSVVATGERRKDLFPKIFTKINIKYNLKGENLDPEAIRKAIKLSEEKYCSVGGMLKNTVEIKSTFQIIEE